MRGGAVGGEGRMLCVVCSVYLQLQQSGIFKSDELITRFFRISVEMCVDLCYRTLGDPVSATTLNGGGVMC